MVGPAGPSTALVGPDRGCGSPAGKLPRSRRCATPDPFFTIEDRGAVRYLTLNRPDTLNAIPSGGWQALGDAFADLDKSDRRILVLAGAGGHFSSGADIAGDVPADTASTVANHRRMRVVSEMATRLHRLSKPTIAVVDGVAVGAGMNLALGCDIVIGTERARFAELFVRRGLIIDAGGTWLLPRIVGESRARELALTGRMVEAEEAAAIGLVTRLVDSSRVDETVAEYVDALLAGAPLAQRLLKVGLDRSSSMTFEEALSWENQAQSILLASADFREAVTAFRERRPPDFTGT